MRSSTLLARACASARGRPGSIARVRNATSPTSVFRRRSSRLGARDLDDDLPERLLFGRTLTFRDSSRRSRLRKRLEMRLHGVDLG